MNFECKKLDKENNKLTIELTFETDEWSMYTRLSEWLKDCQSSELSDLMSDYGFSWSNDILGFTDPDTLIDFYIDKLLFDMNKRSDRRRSYGQTRGLEVVKV